MGLQRDVVILFVAAAVFAGCATDVTASDEYLEVVSARNAVASERDEIEADLVSEQARADELDATIADQRSEIDQLTRERDEALDRIEQLRLTYDDEIRAELQSAYDAELARACDAAKADVDASIPSLIDYNSDWEPIASRASFVTAVTDCAAAERAKTVEQREAERLAACGAVDVDAVVKDPDAFDGDCLVMYAAIWQYDSRTGSCSFLAAVSDRSHSYRYQYGDDAAFISDNDTSCPELDGIDADDHIKVWATGMGPYRYDTAAGGTNEIPLWLIEKVELVRKE